jgi:ribonuclease G
VKKEIVVDVSTRETRIATLEDGQLVELRVEREERVVGSIYKGIVQNVLPGMDAAFVDIGLERNAFLYVADVLIDDEGNVQTNARRSDLRRRKIKDLLKPGQEILVQVIKGPRGTKGARVSTRIALPGRYLVLMPEGGQLGVSRKIENREERERLRRVGQKFCPEGFGLIMRTECEGKSERELKGDIAFLMKTWEQVVERVRTERAPAQVHSDFTLLYRTVRDVFGTDVNRLIVDDPAEYEQVHELAKLVAPRIRSGIHLYDGDEPIFEHYGIESQIDRLLRRKVWLKSGGYLVVDEMEAITAIDVNTGKHVGSSSLADTIVKANLEAVEEVARQIRLRDLGGIIVIDFIDMASAADRRTVMQAFTKALKRDRARTRVGRISSLGLIEITRKRTGESVTETITMPCEHCHGRGRVPSPETVSLWVERELRKKAKEPGDALLIEGSPEVSEWVIGDGGENVEALEHSVRRAIYVRANQEFAVDEYEITSGNADDIEKLLAHHKRAQIVDCDVLESSLSGGEAKAVGWSDDGFCLRLSNGVSHIGGRVKACLNEVRRSYALAEVVPGLKPRQVI